jgi:hypothetical protein
MNKVGFIAINKFIMEKLQGYLTEVLNKLKKVSLLTKDKAKH